MIHKDATEEELEKYRIKRLLENDGDSDSSLSEGSLYDEDFERDEIMTKLGFK